MTACSIDFINNESADVDSAQWAVEATCQLSLLLVYSDVAA